MADLQMSGIIDRVALAIKGPIEEEFCYGLSDDTAKAIARIAIAAMRKPTWAMIVAFLNWNEERESRLINDGVSHDVGELFSLMIDAALVDG